MAYPQLTTKLEHNEHLLVCFNFIRAIRASIYSTNQIESFNKKLKRKTKQREQFLNEAALELTLVIVILDYNSRYSLQAHKGFQQI